MFASKHPKARAPSIESRGRLIDIRPKYLHETLRIADVAEPEPAIQVVSVRGQEKEAA
jgi:hypothetical protein